jgi:hypothetical protein
MDNINDPRHPDFDLRTAVPDPRWLAYRLERTDNYHADLAYISDVVIPMMRAELIAKYQDEKSIVFASVIEYAEARAVVVGYGFSHNPLLSPEGEG